jgi:hypothetical protein
VNVFAFHLGVPPRVGVLQIAFQYLCPVRPGEMTITPNLLEVPWQNLILYAAGYYVRNLPVAAKLKLPASFCQASSLEAVGRSGDVTSYKNTT